MEPFSIASLFETEEYRHAKVFEGCIFAWEALDRLESYLQSCQLGKIESEIPSSATLVDSSLISIGKGCKIEPNAYIQGPCFIGDRCTIRHGAYIRGNVITGDDCVIGHDTEMKHTILLNGVCAAHFNYVGDSILGNKVNLGAGAKCANLRLDHGMVKIFHEGKKIATNLKKLGLIAGDGVQVGCNSVTNLGTILGKFSLIFPCLNISGYVPSYAKVKPSQTTLVENS